MSDYAPEVGDLWITVPQSVLDRIALAYQARLEEGENE